jgi:hypothetical protein
MTIKHFLSNNPSVITTSLRETYGGQEISVGIGWELQDLMNWWKQWGPVFSDSSSTVQDALGQARVLHELGKESNKQPNTYSWTEITL